MGKYKVGDRVRVKLTLDEGYITCVTGKYCEVELDGRNKIETYNDNELEKI